MIIQIAHFLLLCENSLWYGTVHIQFIVTNLFKTFLSLNKDTPLFRLENLHKIASNKSCGPTCNKDWSGQVFNKCPSCLYQSALFCKWKLGIL